LCKPSALACNQGGQADLRLVGRGK